MTEYPYYRVGKKNVRNIYRVDFEGHEGEHVGCFFDPTGAEAQRAVNALNGATLLQHVTEAQQELDVLHVTLRKLRHVYAAAESAADTARMVREGVV